MEVVKPDTLTQGRPIKGFYTGGWSLRRSHEMMEKLECLFILSLKILMSQGYG